MHSLTSNTICVQVGRTANRDTVAGPVIKFVACTLTNHCATCFNSRASRGLLQMFYTLNVCLKNISMHYKTHETHTFVWYQLHCYRVPQITDRTFTGRHIGSHGLNRGLERGEQWSDLSRRFHHITFRLASSFFPSLFAGRHKPPSRPSASCTIFTRSEWGVIWLCEPEASPDRWQCTTNWRTDIHQGDKFVLESLRVTSTYISDLCFLVDERQTQQILATAPLCVCRQAKFGPKIIFYVLFFKWLPEAKTHCRQPAEGPDFAEPDERYLSRATGCKMFSFKRTRILSTKTVWFFLIVVNFRGVSVRLPKRVITRRCSVGVAMD